MSHKDPAMKKAYARAVPADVLAVVATLPPLSPAARSRISLLLRPRQQQGVAPLSGAEPGEQASA